MDISLIVPCFNEEVNIQKGVLDKIGNYTKDHDYFSEVIISDDGSTDETKKLIKNEYLHRYPKFRLLENSHRGKAYTVISGIEKARGEYVMFTDIDLATPIEETEKMHQAMEKGYDIVIGSRNSHREGAPFVRKVMAVGFIHIRNFLIGLKGIRDTQCGFKGFKKNCALRIINNLRVFNKIKVTKESSVSAGFDLEFLFLAVRYKFSIKEVPVMWKHVETKNVNFIRDSLETLQDILRIKYYDLAGKYSK